MFFGSDAAKRFQKLTRYGFCSSKNCSKLTWVKNIERVSKWLIWYQWYLMGNEMAVIVASLKSPVILVKCIENNMSRGLNPYRAFFS